MIRFKSATNAAVLPLEGACDTRVTVFAESLDLMRVVAGFVAAFREPINWAGSMISVAWSGRFLKAVVINSGEKKAMPHKPTMPATPRQTPTIRFLRQRGSLKRSPIEPTALAPLLAAASALARFQGSGSRRIRIMGTAKRAGKTLTNE